MGVLHLLLQTRSVTRTAEVLGVTQPTVSRSLARLRRQLGDPLLVKSGSAMLLTRRAQALLVPLTEWLADGRFLLAQEEFVPAEADREFRVAATDFGVMRVIRPKLRAFSEHAPRCVLTIEPWSAGSLRRLASADIDLVITGSQPAGAVSARRLFRETLTCVVRRGHPLLQGAAAREGAAPPLEDFLGWPHILVDIPGVKADRIGAALRDAGREPGYVVRAEGLALTPYLVAESDAIATLPASIAAEVARIHDLVVLAPPISPGSIHCWIAWHRRAGTDAAVSWLTRLLMGRGQAPAVEGS